MGRPANGFDGGLVFRIDPKWSGAPQAVPYKQLVIVAATSKHPSLGFRSRIPAKSADLLLVGTEPSDCDTALQPEISVADGAVPPTRAQNPAGRVPAQNRDPTIVHGLLCATQPVLFEIVQFNVAALPAHR